MDVRGRQLKLEMLEDHAQRHLGFEQREVLAHANPGPRTHAARPLWPNIAAQAQHSNVRRSERPHLIITQRKMSVHDISCSCTCQIENASRTRPGNLAERRG